MAPRTRRRQFLQSGLALAGLYLLSGCGIPFTPSAERPRLHRIGFLAPGSPPLQPQYQAFLQALRDLGHVEGQTAMIEYRWGEDRGERLPGLARELVDLNVDVIVAAGSVAAVTAKKVTGSIPIVFGASNDPVQAGLVASLGRPGGNVTGLSLANPALAPKRLELLKETVPNVTRVAVLADVNDPTVERVWDETQIAARALSLQLQRHDARSTEDYESAFSAMAAAGAEGLIVLPSAFFSRNRERVMGLAARHRLPAMYEFRQFTDSGGLMSYGANIADLYRRAATYVDKILKGAKPADLPVEQPTTFDFVINLKTAQALGLTIPQSVLLQATEVIQ